MVRVDFRVVSCRVSRAVVAAILLGGIGPLLSSGCGSTSSKPGVGVVSAGSTCVRASDCSSPLVCAADGVCRNACGAARNCLAGQVCAQGGVCADVSEVTPSGVLKNAHTDAGVVSTGGTAGRSGGSGGVAPAGAGGSGGAGAPPDASSGSGGAPGTGGANGGAGGPRDASAGSGGSRGTGGSNGGTGGDASGGAGGTRDASTGSGGSTSGGAGGVKGDANPACPGSDTNRDPLNCGPGGNVCAPIMLAFGNNPTGIAVDATSAYYAANGALMRVPLGGGTPTSMGFAGGMGLLSGTIAVDATSVYSVGILGTTGFNNGRVWKVPRGGGPQLTLASGQWSPNAIAIDSTSVYWTNQDGTVMKVPLGGGTPITLASGQSDPFSVAVDTTSVYWVNGGTAANDGRVMKVPVGGGTPTTLAGGQSPSGIAVDATSVYWMNGNKNVMKVPLGGGTPTILATDPTGAAGLVAVDATSVYWVNGRGQVMRMLLCGGTPTVLASSQSAWAIAVDATSVAWTNSNSYTVMRFDKQACQSGVCKCSGADLVCSGVTPLGDPVGDICVDTSTDSTNCGTCGTKCSGGMTCQGGACACLGANVPCFGICVNTSTDSTNCGTCGSNCAVGKTCQSGTCK